MKKKKKKRDWWARDIARLIKKTYLENKENIEKNIQIGWNNGIKNIIKVTKNNVTRTEKNIKEEPESDK